MTRNQKKTIYTIGGIALSVALLWYLFRDIEFARLVSILKGANYWWLIPNMLLVALAMPQRAFRWQYMLSPIKKVKFSTVMAATCIGFMANNVLPLRLGEFVRAYSLSMQDKEVTKSASLANIFVERMVFDLVALLMIFGLVARFSDLPVDDRAEMGVTFFAIVALCAIGLMLALALKPDQSARLMVKYLFFLPAFIRNRIQGIVTKFSRGLEFLTDKKVVASVAIQTIVLWSLMGISNYFVFKTFGFDMPVTASYVLLVVVSISILVPSSPGFVGVFHGGAVLTLAMYGIGEEEARAFALVLHAAQYIPITLMGFYYLRKEHLSLKTLEEGAEDEE